MQLRLYGRGYSLSSQRTATKSGGGKRGKITGKPSSASFKRLRQFCITHDIDAPCWGVTLTIPGLDLLCVEDFKSMHHKLCVWANDNKLPLVWRVELQQRGQPHLHTVCFGDPALIMRFVAHWVTLLDALPKVYNDEIVGKELKDIVLISRAYLNGSCHAVDIQRLNGDFRAWRYLVAHMSKSKAAQLGWCGRNWGVCNRAQFSEVNPQIYELTEVEYFRVLRMVRRLILGVPHKRKGRRLNKMLEKVNHDRGKESKPFYKRRKARNTSCAFWLGNPDVVKQMLAFARDCYPF